MKPLIFLSFFPVLLLHAPVADHATGEQSILLRAFTTGFTPELAKEAIDYYITENEVAFAQAKLETGNFTSVVFKHNHNMFGMRHPRVRQTCSLGNMGYYACYDHWIYSVWDYELLYQYYVSSGKDFEYILKVYCPDMDFSINHHLPCRNRN